jgi:phosphoribosylformimino-5-aminoimidazole carboxamide ribotide isomerase
MIEIIPSLSILNGKCVRLTRGSYEQPAIYDITPLGLAKQFEDHGVKRLHIVDLDGAKKGSVVNYQTLRSITGHTDLEVDFGGGIQTDGDVDQSLEYGAKMVHVGSLAYTNKRLFSSWLITYSRNRIILSTDVMDGKITVRGRQSDTGLDLYEYIDYYYQRTILHVKCADVGKAGTNEGPNFALYEQLVKRYPKIKFYASGGTSSADDIQRLSDIGVYGVMLGKAYYDGVITLKDIDRFLAKK